MGSVSRRHVLQGIGALGAGFLAGGASRANAADAVTIRWWSPQASPDQLAMYNAQISTFEAANPGVKVLFEPTSDEGYAAQFAAAFAAKQVPNIVTHLPSFAAQNYYGQGLLEPMDDVIKVIGEDKYFPGANDVYKTADGHYCGTPIGNTAADMLWLRKDLMEKAGIDKAPETWDELRNAAQKMQGGGIYGAPLPYGLNSMTSLIFIGTESRYCRLCDLRGLSDDLQGRCTVDLQRLSIGLHSEGCEQHGCDEEIRRVPVRAGWLYPSAPRRTRSRFAGPQDGRGKCGLHG
jgi:multiple sugar transport system substrate-binding protein